MEKQLRGLLNEIFGETWERIENLGHAIGHENIFDEFVKYFDDDTVNKAIDSIARDWDVQIDGGSEEEEIEQEPYVDPTPFETLAGSEVGLNENEEGESEQIVGADIMNHFPFTDLAETRFDEMGWKDVPGWGAVHLPSIETGDAKTTIASKQDVVGGSGSYPYKGGEEHYEYSGYINDFRDKFEEDPVFVLNPDAPWFGKIEVINPKFQEWKQGYLDVKGATLKRWGTTNESVRKVVRKVISEVFWTEKDWEEQLGKSAGGDKEKEELKGDINYYITSDDYSRRGSVEYIMHIAKKIYGDVSEYDLIDTIKGALVDIERENDEMDPTVRNRANEVYDEIEATFEKVNEVVSAVGDSDEDDQIDVQEMEVVDDSGYDYAAEEREYHNKEYFRDEIAKMIRDEFEQDKPESAIKPNLDFDIEEGKKKREPKKMGDPYTISLPSGLMFNMGVGE